MRDEVKKDIKASMVSEVSKFYCKNIKISAIMFYCFSPNKLFKYSNRCNTKPLGVMRESRNNSVVM